MHASRSQLLVTILAGLFLAAAVLIFATVALAPDAVNAYRPLLLTSFVLAMFVGLICIAWILRGLLRPYNQLIGEARRAPVAHSGKSQNEAAFVLETFQSAIARLQDQQKELQRLSELASQRADSAERFSDRIVASLPTGLIAFDAEGRVTVMNGPAQAIFRSERTEGEHFASIFSNAPALAEMVEECLTTGRVFRRAEVQTRDADDGPKRLGTTVAPIDPSPGGGPRGALCLITDITEVTRLREEVALKRNLESLGEMSAGLAHEYKNSMAALHGYAQFLQSVDSDDQGRTAAGALLQEVRNLSEMTTAFLNFARPQALQLEDVSLDELIQECEREVKPLLEARSVSWARSPRVSDRSTEITLRADSRLLRQALLNLLRNAGEAIPNDLTNGEVVIEIGSEVEHGKPWALISIRDTGPGIAASDLQKIFIPFFTTKAHGHGVGLALAHRVVTEHGGTLTAANHPEGGAIFTIKLPAER